MNPSTGRTSGPQGPSASNGQAGDGMREKAAQVGERAAEQASRRFDRGADAAADQMDDVAERIRSAADELDDGEGGEMSQHVARLADGIAQVADTLRNKSADELMRDVRRLAQRNPALFIAGSIAVGFGLSRFAKASGERAMPHETRRAARDSSAAGRHAGRAPEGGRGSRAVDRGPAQHATADAGFAGGLGGNLDPYGAAQTSRREDIGRVASHHGGSASGPPTAGGRSPGAAASGDATAQPRGAFDDFASGHGSPTPPRGNHVGGNGDATDGGSGRKGDRS
jgi:hypothetical protein